jgi:ABC-type lipoprotein release transport system permease subunit
VTAAWRWVRADIARRWPAMLALGLLVALAFGSTLALVAGARRAGSATDRFIRAADLADVTVFIGDEPTPALSHALANDPRIARVTRSDIVSLTPTGAIPGNDGFTAVGIDDGIAGGMGAPMLLSGRYPAPGAIDEVLVNERGARRYGLRPGQRTGLEAVDCTTCRPRPLPGDVTITGVVRTAYDLVDDPSTAGIFLANAGFLDGAWKDALRPGTILWVHLAPGADALAVSQDLSRIVEDGDVSRNITSVSVSNHAGDVQRNALLVAAAVVALMSILALGHAMARFIAGRHVDEPVLSALGMSEAGRWGAAAMLLVPAAAGGSILAGAVALAVSPAFPVGLARRADPDPGVHLDGLVVGIGVCATLLVSAAIVAVVSRRWVSSERRARAAPINARRGVSSAGLPPVPATGVRFAFERGNGSTRPPTRSTVVAVVAAMVVVGGALVLRSSLDGLGSQHTRYGQPWALAVGAADDAGPLAAELARDPRVRAIDHASVGEVELATASGRHAQVGALGIEGVGRRPQLALLDGRQPNGVGEIALGTVTMHDLGLRVGDEVRATGPCGERNLQVTGRVIVPMVAGDTPDEGSVVSLDGFRELCADQLVAEIDRASGLLLTVDADQVDSVANDLGGDGRFVERFGRPSAVTSLLDIRGVALAVALVVGALGLAVAAYALVLSVRRRGGELAVFRALGLAPGQTGRIITIQALAIVAVALVIGLPVGIVAGRLLWRAIAEPANVLVRTDVGVSLLLAGVAMALAIVVVSWWPSRRARRLDVVDALRSE